MSGTYVARVGRVALTAGVAAALVISAPTVGATIGALDRTVAGIPVPMPMAACATELGDMPGQAFPCMWDAYTMGNGHGVSYVLTAPAN